MCGKHGNSLNLSAVVCPVQKGLPLLLPAIEQKRGAVLPYCPYMPFHCLPSLYLPGVLKRNSSSVIISAIPLKPPSGVLWMNPVLFQPVIQRERCVDPKIIEADVFALRGQLCIFKPCGGKLACAVCHVLASENTELKQFLGRKLGTEVGVEVLPLLLGQHVASLLHPVVYKNNVALHNAPPCFIDLTTLNGFASVPISLKSKTLADCLYCT